MRLPVYIVPKIITELSLSLFKRDSFQLFSLRSVLPSGQPNYTMHNTIPYTKTPDSVFRRFFL